jgi:Spy/CpxP family protein refolding chaperone
MRCWTWFLSAALLVAVAIAPVLAADAPAAAPEAKKADAPTDPAAPAAPAPAKPVVEGDLAVMVRECKLTDEQVTKMAAAATAVMQQLVEWQKANNEKLAAHQKAFEAARAASDQAAMAKVQSDAMPLLQERMALITKGQKGMLDILTPEQRSTWLGFITFRQLMVPLAQINLTGEQLTKIREICNAAGKEVGEVKDEGEAGAAAMMKIRTTLLSDVREKILTPEQRTKMEPPPVAPTPPPAAAPKAPETKAPEAEKKAPDAESKEPAKK